MTFHDLTIAAAASLAIIVITVIVVWTAGDRD